MPAKFLTLPCYADLRHQCGVDEPCKQWLEKRGAPAHSGSMAGMILVKQLSIKRHRQSDIVCFILAVAYGIKFITSRGRGDVQGVYVLFLDVRTTRQHAAY
jgi:hypothetical protein